MDLNLRQIAAAIRKDGVPQTRHAYWETRDGKRNTNRTILAPPIEDVVSACAIGMAAINLRVKPVEVEDIIDIDTRRAINIVMLNDEAHKSFDEIADTLEEWAG